MSLQLNPSRWPPDLLKFSCSRSARIRKGFEGAPTAHLVTHPLRPYTIQTFRIILPHLTITPLLTPNTFRGVSKRNLQQTLHLPVLSCIGKIAPTITPTNLLRSNWHIELHLSCTRRITSATLEGPMVGVLMELKSFDPA